MRTLIVWRWTNGARGIIALATFPIHRSPRRPLHTELAIASSGDVSASQAHPAPGVATGDPASRAPALEQSLRDWVHPITLNTSALASLTRALRVRTVGAGARIA